MRTFPISMAKISKVGIPLPYHEICADRQGEDQRKRPRSERQSSLKPPSRVASVPTLASLDPCNEASSLPQKKRMRRSESAIFAPQVRAQVLQASAKTVDPEVKSEEFFQSIVEESGILSENFEIDPNSFLPIAKQQHSSYAEAALAARSEDLPALRKLHEEGNSLQCSNRFGESIIHIVCRRGRDDILTFLLSEAGVTLRLRDDLGRTPLHDAAW